ncbi:oligosaccharide flippase family protein [Amylibacter sp.]|nr:oligosaccharide flippase family protein [Amylibacter sp.]
MNDRISLKKAILISCSSSYLFLGLNFFGQLMLARLLLPDHFGTLAIILALNNLVDIFFSLSVPMAYIQTKQSPTLFNSSFVLCLLSGSIGLMVTLILYVPVSKYYDSYTASSLVFIAFSKPFNAIGSLILADLEKRYKFNKSYFTRGVALVLSMLIAIALANYGFGVSSLIAREVMNGLILFVVAMLYYRQRFSLNYVRREMVALFLYSIKMLFSRGAEILYFKVPILFLASTLDKFSLGLFTQSFYLITLIATALNPITEKVAFVFYSNDKNNDNGGNQTFSIIMLITIFITLPWVIVLYFFPTEILLIFFGEQWVGASKILQSLCGFAIFQSIFNNLKTYFYSIDESIYVTVSYLIALLVCLPILFADNFGLAFSVSMMSATAVLFIIRTIKYVWV